MNSKKQIGIVLISLLLFISGNIQSQNTSGIDIDNHYTGGKDAFFKYISENATYPITAKTNGFVGLSSLSFKIDCNDGPSDFVFETTLNYEIQKALEKTIKQTKGNWLACDEITKNGRVTLNVAYSINGLYGHKNADCIVEAMGDYKVYKDEELVEFFNNRIKKNKYKQAIPYLELLIYRYPFNPDYKKTYSQVKSRLD